MVPALLFRQIKLASPQVILLVIVTWNAGILTHTRAESPGEISPKNVEIAIGGSAGIMCRMNTTSLKDTSASLRFFEENTMVEVPSSHITVLNESTILFTIRNAKEQNSKYTCKRNGLAIGTANVYVGLQPNNITDFSCKGYDYAFLTCGFTKPKNMIHTTYQLIYAPWNEKSYYDVCEFEMNNFSHIMMICNLTIPNDIRYVIEDYNFTLISKNSLGLNRQSFKINIQNNMVPAKPNVELFNITSDSVSLWWKVLKFGHYKKGILEYKITIRPAGFDWIDVTDYNLQYNETNIVKIEHLDYAYVMYNLSVRTKVKTANNDSDMWSETFTQNFRTMARRPDNPPQTDIGSFSTNIAETTMNLYWQQLPEYRENGPHFSYVVTSVKCDGDFVDISPMEMDRISATYPWNSQSHYEFNIKSRNDLGDSLESSYIQIPKKRKDSNHYTPQWIRKVYHNRMYTLSWIPPENRVNFINYTIFWCIAKVESPNMCKSSINFIHLDRDVRNYTTEQQNHTLNLAISANYIDYSTGMHWAMCAAEITSDLMKLDPEISPTSSRTIKVQWSSECIYTSILEGYNLTYCRVANNATLPTAVCLDQNETVISIDKTLKEHEISNLQPYSAYKIEIFMFSAVKKGPSSDPIVTMTREEAPTPPRELSFIGVTSNSANISWLPPIKKNGKIMFYSIWVNNELQYSLNHYSVDIEQQTKVEFKLENLSSFSEYQVYVRAHTVEASSSSNVIRFKTLIGKPSSPLNINATHNSSFVYIQWNRPLVPSGRVEFYEVSMTVLRNGIEINKKICRVKGMDCITPRPECVDPQYSHLFEVRAVNVAEQNEIDHNLLGKRGKRRRRGRRHSNAEISSSVVGNFQSTFEYNAATTNRNEDDDGGAHHVRFGRNERQKYFLETKDEEELRNEKILGDSANEKLNCIGDLVNENDYRNIESREARKMFHSNWQKGKEFICGAPATEEIALVVASVMLLLFAGTGLAYWIRKKYIKMKNIDIVMPEGLADHIPSCNDFDKRQIENRNDDPSRNEDSFYHHKEDHRLLVSICNNSAHLNVGSTGFDGVLSFDDIAANRNSDLETSEQGSQSTDSVELNDICAPYTSMSSTKGFNDGVVDSIGSIMKNDSNDCEYTNPTALLTQTAQSAQTPHSDASSSNGNYILPQTVHKAPMVATFNGYTSLEAMRQPNFPICSSKSNNTNDHNIIGGYVTQKQLSDFGHCQQ